MRTRRGLTLFELMVVMAIMIIIGALAAPSMFQSMDGETKVTAAADLVRSLWADCRAKAIDESRPYRFAVVPNSGRYKIEPYTGTLANMAILAPDTSGGSGGSSVPGGADNSSPGYVIEDHLPKGVRFGTKDVPVDGSSSEADGDYVTVAIFLPVGKAYDDADIMFGTHGSSTVTLHLRALTGGNHEPRQGGG